MIGSTTRLAPRSAALPYFSRPATSGTLGLGVATSSTFLRDAWLIAGFDLRESIRTRRALVLALLYLLVASITSYVYVEVVRLAQQATSEVIGGMADTGDKVAAAAAAGAAQSAGYTGLLYVIAGGDPQIAGHLATYPPMVLVFAWFSLGALPWLIALTSYDLVAGDLHLRTVRFVALRTSRGAFVLGKLLSQVLLVALIAGLGMIPVLAIGGAYLPRFDVLDTFLALLRAWPILALFAFAVLGPVACASQLVRGPGAARALAIVFLFALWVLGIWAVFAPDPLSLLRWLTPFAYKTQFFHPDLLHRLMNAAGCAALCAGYSWIGFQVFRRRDL
ncbi:ABC-2 family transporter protein [Nannocystis exedens]|uniref:ABC-2 family transporter protein n=1 Tax=Nannocystis exedens TaxID=54 RepID=A0A1I2ACH5_9BACT|nr:ABC-2 family transporter protein [Nannocystis exedens]SFE41582.1 ABC-2 family transporter protein [Nannocystis exedens]